MSAIEKLRKLADSTEEIDACAFDMAMMKLGRSVLAVVEAQAAEIRAWREHRRLHDLRSATCHDAESWNAYKKPREKVWYELLAARDNTDAAIRALEGGEELRDVQKQNDANRRLLNKALKENTLLRAECEAVREFEAIDRDAYAPAQTAQEVAAWAGRHRVAKLKMTQARAATDAAGILKGAGT